MRSSSPAAEEMISLSNLLKSFQYISVEDLKLLERAHQTASVEPEEHSDGPEEEGILSKDDEHELTRRQILEEAASVADERLREAAEEAERIVAAAKTEAEAWWESRRQEDEQWMEMHKLEGFEQGYQDGLRQAEAAMKEKADQMIAEASAILEQAYRVKDQIIQDAEPFLVDLSAAIAEKIVDKQLSIEPEYAIELIKKTLSRKREQGVITLCVSPAHFAFVQAARDELALAIDSQAELQILPDSSVKDRGCVIRSAYGSIDATIDTQLTEIKKELYQIALHDEERMSGHENA